MGLIEKAQHFATVPAVKQRSTIFSIHWGIHGHIMIKKRMKISKNVGQIKSKLHIPVEDLIREKEIILKLTQKAGKNLSEGQLIRIFTAVFKSSKLIQR